MPRRLATIVLAAVLGAPVLAADPIVATDLLRLREVSSIDVARDSTHAVFTVRSIAATSPAEDDAAPGYAYRSHLFLLDLTDDDALPRQLTFGDRRDRAPQISPDGRRVAFLRGGEPDRDGGSQGQVWILELDGGEARQLTEREGGAGAPQWSPDGASILFAAGVPFAEIDGEPPYPMERPQRTWRDVADGVEPRPDGTRDEIRAWLAQNAERADPVIVHRLDFQGERTLRDAPEARHLFLADAATGDTRRLTDGFTSHGNAVFMPDGRHVLYVARPRDATHPDRILEREIRQLTIATGADEVLIASEGWSYTRPRPSVDGSMIAFAGRPLDEPTDRQWQLGVVTIGLEGPSDPVWMTEPASFDASVGRFVWMSARASLVFTSAVRGGFPLMTISPGLLKPAPVVEQRDGSAIGVHAFDVGGGAIVYAETSPANPCVLRVRDGHGDRLAMDLNPWVASKSLARAEGAWIDRPDGRRVQYWLMEPTNREPGATYPLCLQIHGGPSAMWGPGERTMWLEFQLLCAWGYGVVYANPRGSGGYGYEFQRANFQDWGDGPAGDVLAAVDHALAMRSGPDPERLVVTGGSYAGYLTAWIVAHDHRFKAAVAQRGVYDLATFFGEGNAWRLVEWEMGGWPWDARYRQVVRRNSPFTFVAQIRTPLLIMHASRDLRTGVSQSEMLYRALKAMDRPVEYVRYPGAGHDLSRTGDPAQRLDRLNRIVEFFERHVENPVPPPVVEPGGSWGFPDPA